MYIYMCIYIHIYIYIYIYRYIGSYWPLLAPAWVSLLLLQVLYIYIYIYICIIYIFLYPLKLYIYMNRLHNISNSSICSDFNMYLPLLASHLPQLPALISAPTSNSQPKGHRSAALGRASLVHENGIFPRFLQVDNNTKLRRQSKATCNLAG